MSVFDGEIEYQSVYMVDFVKKDKPKSPRRKAVDDDCMIVGISRDSLKARDAPRKSPDVLCPINYEFYKNAVERFADDRPKLTKMYMSGELNPIPIDHEIQDLKRTEYLTKYCSRELPFMSVNMARRARALQTLRLPDDVYIPDTSQKGSYRSPKPEKYADPPSAMSMRPKLDDSLQKELRRILRVRTGDTTYGACHGLLAQVVLEKNPFGPPREEPRYGRWRNPYIYTYRLYYEVKTQLSKMDHYLTTYRKDYLWPNLPGAGGAAEAGGLAEVPKLSGEELAFYQACMQHTRPPDCRCPQYSGGEMPQMPPGKEGGWSRNEIMGPMLDPKLYPVRVGASPETPTSRYDQPNAFLDKLQSKYPMLYSILQNEASPELKQRIDRDRNKTTYQVDYCETGPGAKFEGLQRAADESGTGPCAQPMRLPGDPCRVGPKPRMSTPKTISKQGGGGASDPRAKCETTSAVPPLGKSEYQDGVSKLGGIIMRDKLHRR